MFVPIDFTVVLRRINVGICMCLATVNTGKAAVLQMHASIQGAIL